MKETIAKRSSMIDSSIIRIMKARKILEHFTLFDETVKLL